MDQPNRGNEPCFESIGLTSSDLGSSDAFECMQGVGRNGIAVLRIDPRTLRQRRLTVSNVPSVSCYSER